MCEVRHGECQNKPHYFEMFLKEAKSKPARSWGLGDAVAKITRATGLDKLARAYKRVTGKDCGCKKRRDALNKLFP